MNLKLTHTKCRCSTLTGGCGEHFNGEAAFNKHRRNGSTGRECLTPDQMRTKGMAVTDKGYWVTSPWYNPATAK